MRLGDVVAHAARDERGVVIWYRGRGMRSPIFDGDAYVICRRPGVYTCGNAEDDWTTLPEHEWTAVERVRSAMALWEPAPWNDPAENDSYEFAVLTALLPPSRREAVFNDSSWPVDNTELALAVAEWIDTLP